MMCIHFSGTGWPSFSSALEGVEEEDVNAIQATLDGREVRVILGIFSMMDGYTGAHPLPRRVNVIVLMGLH